MTSIIVWWFFLLCLSVPPQSLIVAQQQPAFDYTPFGGTTRRTNLCDLNNLLVAGEIELKQALTGLNLTVGIIDHGIPEFMNFDANGALDADKPGLFPILLDEVARRAGFQWRYSYGQVMPPYHAVNEGRTTEEGNDVTWTDILVDAVDTYDFSFGEWVHNLHRRQLGVGFPQGWFDASTILVQAAKGKKAEFHIITFLKPFNNWVWLMISMVILFSGGIYWTLERLIDGAKRCVGGNDIFFTAMAFTQHHLDWSPQSHSQRLFSFSLSFWALIMASAYTANLASFLVAEDAPAYTSITLEEAYQTKTPVCAREGAAVHNELQRKYPGMHLVTAPSFVETYARLRNGDCFVMATRASDWSKFERDARVNTNDCGLKWIGRAESINGGGAATKIDIGEYCTSLVMHVLDIFFNEMHSDGFIQEAWNAHVESVATNDCSADSAHSNSEEEDGSLRPVDVGGIFVTHGIASFLAIAVALFERQCRKKKKKNGRNNKDQLDDLNIERGEVPASSIEAITMEKVSCGRINRSTGTKREIIYDTSLPSDFQGEQEEMLIKEAMVTLQKVLLCRRNDTLQTERCSETEEV